MNHQFNMENDIDQYIYIFREQSQPFRRGGGARQPSEGWRRSRGDDDENNEQNEDSSTPPSTSHSWTARGGASRRGGGAGSLEQRTKSNEKWSYNDDRSGRKLRNSIVIESNALVFLSKNKKATRISNVDGDRMQLCLIVTLIYVVHKRNEIVRFHLSHGLMKIFTI